MVTVILRIFVHSTPDTSGIVPPTLYHAVLRLPALPRTLLRTMSGAKSYSTSELLVNDPQYSWLRKLGLKEENPGVFDGTWHANGPVRACMHLCLHVHNRLLRDFK